MSKLWSNWNIHGLKTRTRFTDNKWPRYEPVHVKSYRKHTCAEVSSHNFYYHIKRFFLSNKFSFQHFHSKFDGWTWGHWFRFYFWTGVLSCVFCINSESLVWKQTKFDVIFKWLSYQLHVSKAEQDTLTEIYVQNY